MNAYKEINAIISNMIPKSWKYYDFSSNWEEFTRVWNTPDIQEQLCIDMSILCFSNPYNIVNNEGHHVVDMYKTGDPLWKYSASHFWYHEAEKRAQHKIEQEQLIQKFKLSMSNTGIKFRDDLHAQNMFYDTCFESIVIECLPKPDSIESFIITGAESALEETFYKAAQDIFPHDIIIAHDGKVLAAYDKIIFDLPSYYFKTPIDQTYYDNIYTEYYSELASDSTDSF